MSSGLPNKKVTLTRATKKRGTSHVASSPRLISFRHPGYPTGFDIMFCLPALDHTRPPSTRQSRKSLHPVSEKDFGIHLATALQACAIVACNRRGYLSPAKVSPGIALESYRSEQAMEHPWRILTGTTYWFYPVNWIDSSKPYSICPDFANWQFPRHSIPRNWLNCCASQGIISGSSRPSHVSRHDVSCRITAYEEVTEVAHLIPQDQHDWFLRNEMFQFNHDGSLSEEHVTNDVKNSLHLRQDLHTLFNTKAFVFVPKNGTWVVHFLFNGPTHCGVYHNRITQPLLDVSHEFLYARFAWAILPLVSNFAQRRDVYVKVFNEDTMEWETVGPAEVSRKRAAIDISTD